MIDNVYLAVSGFLFFFLGFLGIALGIGSVLVGKRSK